MQGRIESQANLAAGATATASSQADAFTAPAFVLDDNYATRWAAAPDAKGAWIQLDLGAAEDNRRASSSARNTPGSPIASPSQASTDGEHWQTLADFEAAGDRLAHRDRKTRDRPLPAPRLPRRT